MREIAVCEWGPATNSHYPFCDLHAAFVCVYIWRCPHATDICAFPITEHKARSSFLGPTEAWVLAGTSFVSPYQTKSEDTSVRPVSHGGKKPYSRRITSSKQILTREPRHRIPRSFSLATRYSRAA